MKKIIVIIIIMVIPFLVSAHGDIPVFSAEAGILPSSAKYVFDRLGEWIKINLLTPGTKDKQNKLLKQAEERLAEFMELSMLAGQKNKHLKKAADLYAKSLNRSEDYAEQIIFLDGAEIALVYELEERTNIHEKTLIELIEENPEHIDLAREVLSAARAANEKAFKYAVEKYQFTDSDIAKNKAIIGREIAFMEKRVKDLGLPQKDRRLTAAVTKFIKEAKKFHSVGLSVQAYDFVKQAKDLIY